MYSKLLLFIAKQEIEIANIITLATLYYSDMCNVVAVRQGRYCSWLYKSE